MPIDSREDRQSAFGFLLPFLGPGVEPDPDVDAAERQAAGWTYSGILAEAPPAPLPSAWPYVPTFRRRRR